LRVTRNAATSQDWKMVCQNNTTSKPLLTRQAISTLFDCSHGSCSSNNRGKAVTSSWNLNVFVGRQIHLAQLETTFQRVMSTQKSETVIIQGVSGVGKTTLVKEFVKNLPPNAFYVRGKFDQSSCRGPFCVLIAIAEQLCRQILRSNCSEEIRIRIRDILGSELSLLGNLVPELTKIHSQFPETSKRTNTDSSSHRFKQVFRSLLRSAASIKNPLIIFLDDLQAADVASIEVLKAIVNDTLSRCIFIIGTIRVAEAKSDSNIFSENQQSNHNMILASDDENERSYITYICVEKLQMFELNNMISIILHMEERAIQSLSSLVMNKTDGNPFYVINFLEMLHSTGLLSQGLDDKWNWDENRIRLQTNVADNLIQVLEARLLRIPSHARSILQIASFIGNEFTSNILSLILHEEQDMIEGEYSFERHSMEEIRKRISFALVLATEEGLLESTIDSTVFKFAHDKIRQALYEDLMPDHGERQLLHLRIGQLILESLKSHHNSQICDERSIFLATNNLNRALNVIETLDTRVEIARLNLRAGKSAIAKSDFVLASEYLRAALQLLPPTTSWTSHYDLCMDLFCIAANVEKILGCYDRCDELVKEILKNADSLEHQCAAYEIQINCLAAKGDIKAAVILGLDILRKLRVPLPGKFSMGLVAKEFLLVKLALGRKPIERILDKPELTDQRMINVLSVMTSVRFNTFLLGDSYKEIFVFMVLRTFRITIKCGLSPLHAPFALIAWGTLHAAMGDYNTAIRCSQIAFSIIDKLNSESIRGRASLISYGTLYFWRHRLDEGISDKILLAYHHAMSNGDIFFAKFGVVAWIVIKTYWDDPISAIHEHARIIVREMREDNAKQALLLTLPTWQYVSNSFQ
jgi:predicted ATPase